MVLGLEALLIWGAKKRGSTEGPGLEVGLLLSSSELRPPWPGPSPVAGHLGSAVCAQEMAGLDFRKIKGAKSGPGWGRCQEKDLQRGSSWEAQRSRPGT